MSNSLQKYTKNGSYWTQPMEPKWLYIKNVHSGTTELSSSHLLNPEYIGKKHSEYMHRSRVSFHFIIYSQNNAKGKSYEFFKKCSLIYRFHVDGFILQYNNNNLVDWSRDQTADQTPYLLFTWGLIIIIINNFYF